LLVAEVSVSRVSVGSAVVELKNRKRIQNHIGGIHACGIALAAESASGYMVFSSNALLTQICVRLHVFVLAVACLA
jgi:acyl-coenzyme A thioesterase PaaI-like protein